MRERVSLAFGVGPKEIVPEFVINRLHPHPFTFVNAPLLPIFGMNQMDPAVLERSARGLAPIDVLVPFD